VGIARSLAVEPDVWFLDEPFSALDPLIRREMQDEFIRLQSLLHKTIVFITHDFDEAIRLADRIAIMKDGEVIQIATPEQLVLNPATDYVEEFTRHIPRSKIVTVGSIMSSVKVTEGTRISASATVDEVSKTVVESRQVLPVVDADDQVIGSIGREAVINVLINVIENGELNS
jgi:glycine betaine/proline transport system ATP-binding protein